MIYLSYFGLEMADIYSGGFTILLCDKKCVASYAASRAMLRRELCCVASYAYTL